MVEKNGDFLAVVDKDDKKYTYKEYYQQSMR